MNLFIFTRHFKATSCSLYTLPLVFHIEIGLNLHLSGQCIFYHINARINTITEDMKFLFIPYQSDWGHFCGNPISGLKLSLLGKSRLFVADPVIPEISEESPYVCLPFHRTTCLTILSSWLLDWSSLVLSSVSEDVGIPSCDNQSEWRVNRFESMATKACVWAWPAPISLPGWEFRMAINFSRTIRYSPSACGQIVYLCISDIQSRS